MANERTYDVLSSEIISLLEVPHSTAFWQREVEHLEMGKALKLEFLDKADVSRLQSNILGPQERYKDKIPYAIHSRIREDGDKTILFLWKEEIPEVI